VSRKFITLLTDFGEQDPYVAIMKGVIYQIVKDVTIIDITHSIPPGDIAKAGFILKESFSYFPKGTIHVCVVDPGVGTQRKPVLVLSRNYFFVAPDNGLIWPAIKKEAEYKVYVLDRPKFFLPKVSNTFHGRDIFAPVAAHLANGVNPEEIGSASQDELQKVLLPEPIITGDCIIGKILHVDRFGNLITNIPFQLLEAHIRSETIKVEICGQTIHGIKRTFQDADLGEPLAYVGSFGYLEIGINMGSAFNLLIKHQEGMEEIIVKVSGFNANNS